MIGSGSRGLVAESATNEKYVLPLVVRVARRRPGLSEMLLNPADGASAVPGMSSVKETPAKYGFLGTGAIAQAIVTGLCEGSKDAPTILLSPRSAARAADLAGRYSSVEVASDNQALADRASIVVICVRPQDASEIVTGLQFAADQAIVSVMAGVPINRLAELVAPATNIARAIPLPSVARRAGVTPITPQTDAARGLFDDLGGSLVVTDTSSFDALTAATATIAAHFRYLGTISLWLSTHGIDQRDASRYVSSMFADVGATLDDVSADLSELAADHATPGGINERFSAMLEHGGTFELVSKSLENILHTLRT